MSERFHIAEWYGHPFEDLTEAERVAFAQHKKNKNNILSKNEITRLHELKHIENTNVSLMSTDNKKRLDELEEKINDQTYREYKCPFKQDNDSQACTKDGGVCSIRLYTDNDGTAHKLDGDKGRITSLCPARFYQKSTAFKYISEYILNSEDYLKVQEVGFLSSYKNKNKKIGKIDMVIIDKDTIQGNHLEWCALEIQAVYFSGDNMGDEFTHIIKNNGKLTMPVGKRRPDYRSSASKRLMPQLQTKIPALRRWGKKMAVLVDSTFFDSIVGMKECEELSNCDVIWFIADFIREPKDDTYHIEIIKTFKTTMESTILGLTGGIPVSREDFEDGILKKITP